MWPELKQSIWIIVSDSCTRNVSRIILDDYRSINYKNIMIVNDNSSHQNDVTTWSVIFDRFSDNRKDRPLL